MKAISLASLGLLVLGILACEREPAIPEETNTIPMIVNGLEVSLRLSRDSSVYSFQEDIHLLVSFRNPADTEVVIPHLPGYPSTWILKNQATGMETTKVFRPTPIPGLPLDPEPPQASLTGKASHTYALEVSRFLGPIPPGKHSIRYRLDSSLTRIESPWFDFEVGAGAQSESYGGPSNAGHAHEFRLAWVDRAFHPARVLLRTVPIHDNRNLPATTKVIGSGEVRGGLGVSASYADSPRLPAWVAWLEPGKLRLVNAEGMDPPGGLEFDLPEGASWEMLEILVAAPQGRDGLAIAGALRQADGSMIRVQGFEWKGGKDLQWLAPYTLAPGTVRLPPALIPGAEGGAILGWIQENGGQADLCWASRKPGEGFIAEPTKVRLESALGEILDFDLKPGPSGLAWTVLSRDSRTAGYQVAWGVNGKVSKSISAKPKVWSLTKSESGAPVDVSLDIHANPWVLLSGPEGARVQSREWKAPTPVRGSNGSETAKLFFRRGDLPKVLLKGKETGFTIASVQYPDGSDTSEDIVEDNQ